MNSDIKELTIDYLEVMRDLIVKDLKDMLSASNDSEILLAAANNEINMIQFLIDNIENPYAISENPYSYSWFNDTLDYLRKENTLGYSIILNLYKAIFDK